MAGFRQISYIAILSLAALPALAHDAAEKVGYVAPHGGGFMAGLSHPVLGFDHLLAMISVGVLSAQMGGRAIWQVPLTFVFLMLLGGVAGMQKVPLFSVELGIAISVLRAGNRHCRRKQIFRSAGDYLRRLLCHLPRSCSRYRNALSGKAGALCAGLCCRDCGDPYCRSRHRPGFTALSARGGGIALYRCRDSRDWLSPDPDAGAGLARRGRRLCFIAARL